MLMVLEEMKARGNPLHVEVTYDIKEWWVGTSDYDHERSTGSVVTNDSLSIAVALAAKAAIEAEDA
jgi:hypothetical protein